MSEYPIETLYRVADIYSAGSREELLQKIKDYKERTKLQKDEAALEYLLSHEFAVPTDCIEEISRLNRRPTDLEIKAMRFGKKVRAEGASSISITIDDLKF
jgi:hypothetical protein